MRRTMLRFLIASIAFAAGVTCARLHGVVTGPGGPSGASPAAAYRTAAEAARPCRGKPSAADAAPEDFGQFWARFKSAVGRGDKEALYALTSRESFTWEPTGLTFKRTPKGDESAGSYDVIYAFHPRFKVESYDEFSDNYERIFTRAFRKAVLTGEPSNNWYDSYILSFPAGGEGDWRTVMFVDEEGRGYKFTGVWDASRLRYPPQVSDGK